MPHDALHLVHDGLGNLGGARILSGWLRHVVHLPANLFRDALRRGTYLAPEFLRLLGVGDSHQVLKGGPLAKLNEKEDVNQEGQNGAPPHQPHHSTDHVSSRRIP
jgi:hypothetical protein